jgi:hypothetical protein
MSQSVTSDEQSGNRKLVLLPREEYRRKKRPCSRQAEWRYVKEEDHPQPILNGRFYIEAEIDAYMELLVARERGTEADIQEARKRLKEVVLAFSYGAGKAVSDE